MSRRRLLAEAAFGFTPFSAAPTWTELTSGGKTRIRDATWTMGRNDELDHFDTGTATLVLLNRDRALDPNNPSSPYAGQLLPYVPVRIRSQDLDTLAFQDEFYGYVQGGWEQILAPKGTGDVKIELVDLLGVIAGYKLPDVLDQAVLARNPVGYWVLDGGGTENAGQVVDKGTGRRDGTTLGEGVTLGDKPMIPGHRPAARFDVSIVPDEIVFGSIDLGRSPLLYPVSWADPLLMITFLPRSLPTNVQRTLFIHSNTNAARSGLTAFIDAAGKLEYIYLNNGAGVAYVTPDVVVGKAGLFESQAHIMFGAGAGLGLDTPTLSTGTTSGGIGKKNGASIGGGVGIHAADHMDGWIGVVALFASNTTVGSAGRQAIFDAFSKLSGLRTDEQISWALDRIGATGIPAAFRNLDQGTVYLGAADTDGKDALEWMRLVTATESGGLYVDHRNGGKVRFTNRYTRFLSARSTTSQAAFSDLPGATGVIKYPAEGLDISPNGPDGIVNQATVKWVDGEVTYESALSVLGYGPRPRDIETVATTPHQARSVAEWLVTRYAGLRSRIRGVATKGVIANRNDLVQALRIDDRVTFRVQPLHIGTAITVNLFVDGITNHAHGLEWETSFNFAQVDTFIPWIWGTSAWGQTTVWG